MSRSRLHEQRAAGARHAEEVFNLFSAASRRPQADGQPSLVEASGSEATPKPGSLGHGGGGREQPLSIG